MSLHRANVEQGLMDAFRNEFHDDLAKMRAEWEGYSPSGKTTDGDLAELRRSLHTLKGSARLLNFAGLPEQVHELEEFVLSALRSQQKPTGFWDALADLEESVAILLGEPETSVELDLAAGASVASPAGRASSSSGYSLLLSVDELLALSRDLTQGLQTSNPNDVAQREHLTHQANLLVERSRALREETRRMTLVPSDELFVGLTELARRAASDQGKEVRVTHQVVRDQLERDMVLGLRPALLHLTQNAVSHGIEHRAGTITFGFQREPGELVVSVRDNGKGLSREALKRAVIGAGLLTDGAWEAQSDAQQLQWVFHPGISTRTTADISAGRGMGLAVVSDAVERLGGRVEIQSSREGTEFRLLIPTAWNLRAILRVRSGQHDFAVLSSELVGAEAAAIKTDTVVRRLGELSVLLGYPGNYREGNYSLLVDKPAFGSLSIGVDEMGDFEEVLVTPLQGYSGLPPAVVGVTPSQGLALPVVSLKALLNIPIPRKAPETTYEVAKDAPTLLVVDDSVTTRTLVTGILRAEGYRVLVAADGQQGLQMSLTPGLALIVSDYQMPILDGLGFLEALRADPKTGTVPFILLTSIDDVATFEKASGLGADRCLGKQNFTQELLLKTVRELL